jgi:hypothetical protein
MRNTAAIAACGSVTRRELTAPRHGDDSPSYSPIRFARYTPLPGSKPDGSNSGRISTTGDEVLQLRALIQYCDVSVLATCGSTR